MRDLRILPILLLLQPLPVRAQEVDKNDLDKYVLAARREWNVPGVSVAVVREGRVVYLAGHGGTVMGGTEWMTPDTLFPLASCSKGFTTAALAMLVDEGKLKWDDPVRKHVQFFRLSDPLADRDCTLRDLLCHRTGLNSHDYLWHDMPWKPEEVVRRAGRLPLDRPFRTGFRYQSTMYTAAGLAVGSASGSPWDEFVRKRLFEPLGMKTAGCSTEEAFKSRDRAGGHCWNDRGKIDLVERWYPFPEPDAALSIHASVRDLVPWMNFQLNGGVHDGKRLVSERALRETHTPQVVLALEGQTAELHPETSQMSYAMAWVVQDYRGWRLLGHGGVIDGFAVQITLVPKAKLGIATLANLQGTRMNLALTYTLLDRLLGLKPRDWNATIGRVVQKSADESAKALADRWEKRHRNTSPSRRPGAYTGDYEHPAYGPVKIELERGKLVWRLGGLSGEMEHFHYETFVVRPERMAPIFLTFALGADAAVKELAIEEPFGVTFKRK